MEAHQQLEELILDRETLKYKRLVSVEFAELVYAAKWFSPLREALTAFVDKTQEYVTGTTNFRLYKGNIIKEGTTSPYSLYDEDIASFKLVIYMIIMTLKDSLLYMVFQLKYVQ